MAAGTPIVEVLRGSEKEDGNPDLHAMLVHDWLPTVGGSEAVFREICSMYDGPVVTSLLNRRLFPWLEGRAVQTSGFQRLPFIFRRHYVVAPWMPRYYGRVRSGRAELLLVDSHSFAHHVPGSKDCIYLCYYHTSARSLWNPEIDNRALAGRLGFIRNRLVPRLKRLDLLASKNPDYVIANSEVTAQRLRDNYGREPDEVIYPPVSVRKWLDTPRIDRSEGFLIWGRLIDYKRVDLAIAAALETGLRLNVVGAGPLERSLKKQAGGAPNIKFHGHLPEARLRDLVSRSAALLFPGYEDFGIVPVEAMAAGLPVIAYGQGGAVESVGNLGILMNEQTSEQLGAAMREILDRTFDVDQLRQNALRFDADVFRRRYKEAVANAIAKFRHKLEEPS